MSKLQQRLRQLRRFQKTLALYGGATCAAEAEAAELAARRLLEVFDIDPVVVPNSSLYDYTSFANNSLLAKLRAEYRAAHPNYYYSKPEKSGFTRRLKRKPRPPRAPKPADHRAFAGMFGELDDMLLSKEKTS
jgi:hypothetical protein